jgi:hypothetical protein
MRTHLSPVMWAGYVREEDEGKRARVPGPLEDVRMSGMTLSGALYGAARGRIHHRRRRDSRMESGGRGGGEAKPAGVTRHTSYCGEGRTRWPGAHPPGTMAPWGRLDPHDVLFPSPRCSGWTLRRVVRGE